MYRFAEVDPARYLEEIGRLRAKVWLELGAISESQLVQGMLVDKWDRVGRHWACFFEERIVAAGRLNAGGPEDICYGKFLADFVPDVRWPSAELFRLVVAADHRGKGLGSELDRLRIAAAAELGCTAVYGMTFTRPEMLRAEGFIVLRDVSAEEYLSINGYRASNSCFLLRKDLP